MPVFPGSSKHSEMQKIATHAIIGQNWPPLLGSKFTSCRSLFALVYMVAIQQAGLISGSVRR